MIIPVNEPLLVGREAEYIADCVKTGWISSTGAYIDRFEKEWAAYCGRKHGIAVCNGTVALELALSALDLPHESEVILPSFTIASCLEAVLRNNLKPVLTDCDPRTYCMDIADARCKITNKTKAIMPVHIYGHPVNMPDIISLAKEFSLKIVEDAAEAHGAECLVNNTWHRCGGFGEVSAFSFYANKNISCGEGGMVLTDDDGIAETLRNKKNLCFGNRERFRHTDRGWNFRMTNMQAAVGCAQLEQIEKFLQRKLDMAAMYYEGLKDLPLQLPHVEPWAKSTVWMYAVLLKNSVSFDAMEFAKRLSGLGIQTRPFFLGMHAQPVYLERGLIERFDCPVTDKIYKRGLYLPSGQAITNDQITAVVASVRKVLS